MFDIARLASPQITTIKEPFPLLVGRDLLPAELQDTLLRDFPDYGGAGFFPYDAADCGPSMRALVDELSAPAFSNVLGVRLGLDLSRFPTLVTLCRTLNRRHGTIHTDSTSKIATALVYLSPHWPETSEGCLRFLARIDDIEATVVPEIRPVYGTIAAFKRTGNSFHGHLPHAGMRPVIQIAWLTSEREKSRKTRRGRGSRLVKKLAGRLDRWIGSDRDRDASHRD